MENEVNKNEIINNIKSDSNLSTSCLKSIWFWWILLTIINLALGYYLSFHAPQSFARNYSPYWYLFFDISSVMYLFTSIDHTALMNLFIYPNERTIISIIVFLICSFSFQKWLNKRDFTLPKTILIIFFALFILTTLEDLVDGSFPLSWKIFIEAIFNYRIR